MKDLLAQSIAGVSKEMKTGLQLVLDSILAKEAERKAQLDTTKALEDHAKVLIAVDKVTQEVTKSTDMFALKLKESEDAFNTSIAEIDMTPLEKSITQAMAAIDKLTEKEIEAQSLIMGAKGWGGTEEFDKAINNIQDMADKSKGIVADLIEFKLAKEQSWATGTASAFDEYLRNAGNAATQAKDLWTAGFKGMEDMLTNFFMKGKLGVKDFITVIEQALARLAAQTFVVNIAGAVGMSGIAGTAAASTAASGTAGVGSWLNAGSTINGAYNAMTGGLSATYASMANSTVGGYLGLSTQAAVGYAAPVYDAGGNLISAGTGGSAGGMTSLGSSVGTGLGYAGAGMAGIAAGSLIAGNKQVVGLDGTTISAIGAVIGSIWGPVGTFIGGVAGGVLDAAFGMGPKQSGTTTLAGQFSQSGFSGAYQTPWTQDGGWFRSDQSGTNSTATTAAQSTAFQAMVSGTQSVFDKLTAASGEAKASLTGWTFAINQQVSTQAQQTQLISDVATSMGNYLIPSLAQFGKTGETLADTAVRITDEFILTDKIASLMGKDTASAFGAIGMASAAARDSLVTLMGGVQNMTTVTQSYYTNFFSASEQHAIDLKALADQFVSLGMVMPGTRDAFRTLVEQQDLATTAGQQMYASLMSLNAAFAAVIPASAAAANAVLSLADQITATTTAAQTAVDAQIAASKSAASTAQNLAASYRQITVTLADEVAKIRGTNSTSGNLQSLYQTAMGGDATALAALPKAADDFLAASLATAKTSTEYAAAQAQVIGMLNNAGTASTGMANWYDNQTTLLQTQATLLDQIKTELAGPTPDMVLLNQQAGLLQTLAGLLQDQTTQIVTGNGTQTLLMQDQTGKIILANGLTTDQTGVISLGNSLLNGTIDGGININSAASIGGYLDTVGSLLAGNNSNEAASARAALEVLRQTTSDGLITTAEAAATTDALATLRNSAALQSLAALQATTGIQSAIDGGININSATIMQGLLAGQTAQIIAGNLVLSDQKGLITSSNQLLVDQTGKITLGNALVGTQTNQIITGNSTADVIKNLSNTGNTYSEEMLRALVSGATMQTDSLTSILTDNDKTVSLLQQLFDITNQQAEQTAAAAAAQSAADAKAAADRALQLQTTQATAAYNSEKSVFDALQQQTNAALDNIFGSGGWSLNTAADVTANNPGVINISYTDQSQLDALSALQPGFIAEVQKAYDLWKAIPGHASGLDRVPYDNYLMRAHKDEAILTAPQAATWRAGGTGAANDAVVMEIRALRTEMAGLRSETAGVRQAANATAKNTKDASNIWTRVTRDGESLVTVAG